MKDGDHAANGVLFVGNFLSKTGGNRDYCEDLTDRLEANGRSILRTSNKLGRAERLADMLQTAWVHRQLYGTAHVSVYSGPAFVWAEAVCFLLRRLHKPYVLTLHGGNLPVFARRWPRRVRTLLASAASVTAPSEYLRHRLAEVHPAIVVLPNGIEATAYAFRARVTPQPRLIWLRAFHAIYNPSLAVEVLAQIRPRHPGATLRMIGPDKADGSRAACVERARELGVADAVELIGPVPKSEVARQLRDGDVFLNTSNIDNTPVSVLEAAAAGLAIVSTSVGGIPFLLEHGRSALLVPPADPVAMARAAERILHEPGLGEALSRNARSLAIRHDWPAVITQWESVFNEMENPR